MAFRIPDDETVLLFSQMALEIKQAAPSKTEAL